jgi:hypothetical protein
VTADSGRRDAEEHSPLVGTVVGGARPTSDGVRPVDTTRITGASRALRNTGSFRVPTGAQPRATGSFRGTQDTSLLRRPYYQAPDE